MRGVPGAGYLLILLAAILWGLLGPISRFALESGVDPLELAFWRALLGGAIFAAHAGGRGRLHLARRDLPPVVGFGLVGVALFYGAYFRAVERGGAALAAVLLYTAPFWVALLARIFLKEPMSGRKLGALALAVAGVGGIALSGGGDLRFGGEALAWGLLAGWCYALYYLFGKRFFDRYDPPTLFAWALPVGAIALLPFVPFGPKGASEWTVVLFLAVVPTYLAYLLYGLGLRRVEATRAATVATVEPVVAAVAAYLLWGERLSPAAYVFAGLVILGVVRMVSGGQAGGPTSSEG